MREFVQDQWLLMEPSSITRWVKDFANCSDKDFRIELYRIQHKLAQLIWKDVCSEEGVFYYDPIKPSQRPIEECTHLPGDHGYFMTFDGICRFPLRSSQKYDVVG
jgi:hypothetical protein